MKAISLTSEQKRAIRAHLQAFRRYADGEQFQEDQKHRLSRVSYFQERLPERLAELLFLSIEEVPI